MVNFVASPSFSSSLSSPCYHYHQRNGKNVFVEKVRTLKVWMVKERSHHDGLVIVPAKEGAARSTMLIYRVWWQVNASGDTQVVRRDPLLQDNALLPDAHCTRVGDR